MADDTKYPTRIAPYGLRMSPMLKARVQTSADANSRSMHAELISAIESAYPEPIELDVWIARIEEMKDQLDNMPKTQEWADSSNNLIELIDDVKRHYLAPPEDDNSPKPKRRLPKHKKPAPQE